MRCNNSNIHKAKIKKNDEFYTNLEDIEKELINYKKHFKDKIVYCNCDNPFTSNFVKYFIINFNSLGLKKLIATCYNGQSIYGKQLSIYDYTNNQTEDRKAYKLEINEVDNDFDINKLLLNNKNALSILKENGDFSSSECIDLLKEADVVVTNPPFSLFREYVKQLMDYNKKFLIIGSVHAITYKEIFNFFKMNKLWHGVNYIVYFSNAKVQCRWFTNLLHNKRNGKLTLYEKYYDYYNQDGTLKPNKPDKYPKFVNYDAINVDITTDIPQDYDGVMGVPITFLDKYNPDQFEIVSFRKGIDGKDLTFIEKCGGEKMSTLHTHTYKKTASLGLITGAKETMCKDNKARFPRIAIKRKDITKEETNGKKF